MDEGVFSRLEPELDPNNFVFERIVNALNSNQPIVYSKINHGFWERLVALEGEGFDIFETDHVKTHEMDYFEGFRRPTPFMFEGGFACDILSDLKKFPHADTNHIFSAGLLGWPGRLEVAGLSQDHAACQAIIKRLVPEKIQTPHADGMEFKWALITGAYERFAKALRKRECLLVGNKNLSRYFEFMGVEQGRFLEVHASQARVDREAILENILAEIDANDSLKTILLQAGGSLSAWLIFRIHQLRPNISLIDIGLGSLICNPAKIFPTAFGRIYRRQLGECMDKIHAGWKDKFLSGDLRVETSTGRSQSVMAMLATKGVAKPIDFFDPEMNFSKPLAFDLKLPSDDNRVKQIDDGLENSREVATDLLKGMLSLSEDEDIILFYSYEEAQKILSQIEGVQKHSICDHKQWNIFRRETLMAPSNMVIENNIGFLDRPKLDRPKGEIEIVGFDATKPYGVGEAVLLICANERSAHLKQFMTRKSYLSDSDSSKLIECFERYERWSFFYQRQIRRITQLIDHNFAELEPVVPRRLSPVPSLLYYYSKSIEKSSLENPFFELRVDADNSLTIIEIPCHPYMRHISNSDFVQTLKDVLKR